MFNDGTQKVFLVVCLIPVATRLFVPEFVLMSLFAYYLLSCLHPHYILYFPIFGRIVGISITA